MNVLSRILVAAALCAIGNVVHAQDADVNAGRARANFARPVVLAAADEDVLLALVAVA